MKRIIFAIIFALLISGCGNVSTVNDVTQQNADSVQNPDLKYATQFSVTPLENGCYQVDIKDDRHYMLIPRGNDGPVADCSGYTVIRIPVESVYLAASSTMDMFKRLDALESVSLTSTKDWSVKGIDERLSDGRLYYIGKYMAPDYEALLEAECDLALESTMIYHSPGTGEEIESLGIPMLVERSSYESDPLGRLEWIKLYGLLLGREELARDFFDAAEKEVQETAAKAGSDSDLKRPEAAFFSVSGNGYVTVRKNNDYVTKMIEMAGGEYVPKNVTPDNENALSTLNMQMEAFVDGASDADFLIYNSAIRSGPETIDELLEMSDVFERFKAVKSGDVWCTRSSVFQETTAVSDIIREMSEILSGESDETDMEFFYRLK